MILKLINLKVFTLAHHLLHGKYATGNFSSALYCLQGFCRSKQGFVSSYPQSDVRPGPGYVRP